MEKDWMEDPEEQDWMIGGLRTYCLKEERKIQNATGRMET